MFCIEKFYLITVDNQSWIKMECTYQHFTCVYIISNMSSAELLVFTDIVTCLLLYHLYWTRQAL